MKSDALYEEISQLPVIDVHSHLHPQQLEAEHLHDVVYYHMLRYPLRAAGVPEGEIWARGRERESRDFNPFAEQEGLMDALATQNFGRTLRQILAELYDFTEWLTPESYPRLKERFDARVQQPGWGREVLKRLNVERVMYGSRQPEPPALGDNADIIGLGIETGFQCGTHEYRSWTDRLQQINAKFDVDIRTVDDITALTTDFFSEYDWQDREIYIAWISDDADFRPVADAVVNGIISRARDGAALTPDEGRLLEAAFTRATCAALQDKIRIFQVVYGIQFLTPGPALHPITRTAPCFAATLGRLAGEFPGIHFNILNGCEADEQTLGSLCNAYANISLAGVWWNSFFPSIMHAAWHRRLDIVPLTRLCAFFSDGYCVDWIYGRIRTTQRVLANVLAERIEWGMCRPEDAVKIAKAIFYDTPKRLFIDGDLQ